MLWFINLKKNFIYFRNLFERYKFRESNIQFLLSLKKLNWIFLKKTYKLWFLLQISKKFNFQSNNTNYFFYYSSKRKSFLFKSSYWRISWYTETFVRCKIGKQDRYIISGEIRVSWKSLENCCKISTVFLFQN